MTTLFEKAVQEVAKLSPAEQDRIGAELLETREADRKWDESFANSQDLLDRMGEEALKDHREGRTEDGGFDGR